MLEYRSLDRSCTLPVVWPSNLTVLTAKFIVQSDIYCPWRHEFFSVIISWNVYPKCISYRKSAFMMISSYDDLRDHSKLKHVVNVSGSLPGADKMNMCTGMFDDLQCCNILFLRCHLTVMFVCIQIGKAAFQRHNDPLDAALFYLAMKKKAVLWGLFRYLHYSWIELLSSLIEVFHITFMGCWDVCFFFFFSQVSAWWEDDSVLQKQLHWGPLAKGRSEKCFLPAGEAALWTIRCLLPTGWITQRRHRGAKQHTHFYTQQHTRYTNMAHKRWVCSNTALNSQRRLGIALFYRNRMEDKGVSVWKLNQYITNNADICCWESWVLCILWITREKAKLYW